MNWVETLNGAIDYIEDNLLDDISLSEIARHAHISNEHLQRGFSALADVTIGEYIRNRRLSLAGLELTYKDVKVIDVAMKYGYETSESFSKAFNRFHGIAPMAAKKNSADLKSYSRLTVKIIMEGGTIMDYRIIETEAFEVVAKIDGFETAEDIANQVLSGWSIEGKASPRFRNLNHVIRDKSDGEYMTKWYSHETSLNGELLNSYKVWQVPEYTWAVFKCVGDMSQAYKGSREAPPAVSETWKRIYSEWLPQAEYEILPLINTQIIYPNATNESMSDMCEIWLPVKKK